MSTLFNGVLRGGSVFRKALQDKLCKQKLPFRQAVEESLRCFDDAILNLSKLSNRNHFRGNGRKAKANEEKKVLTIFTTVLEADV